MQLNLAKTHYPLVSICIPLYNAEEYISETILNLLNQSYENLELIIVDDHSSDRSVDIVKSYYDKRIHLFTNPKKGGNSARNFAFTQSVGQLIKFVDADDLCEPELIEKQVLKYLERNNTKNLIFSPVCKYYGNRKIELLPRTIDKDYKPGIELVIGIWVGQGFNCPHCYLMSRELIELSGGWNEAVLKNQDGEFFARVAATADEAISVPEVMALWRQTYKGVSANLKQESVVSHFDTLIQITEMVLDYDNKYENRQICENYIGLFVFTFYYYIYEHLTKLEILTKKYNFEINYPRRKKFLLFRMLLGKHKALIIMSKLYNHI